MVVANATMICAKAESTIPTVNQLLELAATLDGAEKYLVETALQRLLDELSSTTSRLCLHYYNCSNVEGLPDQYRLAALHMWRDAQSATDARLVVGLLRCAQAHAEDEAKTEAERVARRSLVVRSASVFLGASVVAVRLWATAKH